MLRLAARAAVLALAAAALPAQPLVAYGLVTVRDGGFALLCPDVRLTGNAAELRQMLGRTVRLTGTAGTTQPPVIAVATIEEAADVFELGGAHRIGGDLRFKVVSPRGRVYYFALAAAPGFLPLDARFPGIGGTFFLDVASFAIVASGPFTAAWEVRLPVPADPSLVGLRLWAQAAISAEPGTAVYLNAACATLRV